MEKKLNKGNEWTARSEMTHEQEVSLTHDLPPRNVVSSLRKIINHSSNVQQNEDSKPIVKLQK